MNERRRDHECSASIPRQRRQPKIISHIPKRPIRRSQRHMLRERSQSPPNLTRMQRRRILFPQYPIHVGYDRDIKTKPLLRHQKETRRQRICHRRRWRNIYPNPKYPKRSQGQAPNPRLIFLAL